MRRRRPLFGSLAAVIAVATAVFLLLARGPAPEPDPDPLAPHAYVARALALIRANAVYAPALDWPALSAEVHRRTGPATTAKETHEAVRYAIEALRSAGDQHAGIATATEMKQLLARRDLTSPSPEVSFVQGRLGLVTLLGIDSASMSANSRAYARSALRRIAALEAKRRPCGWIVDLRRNTGGNMGPMLLAVGPIVGEGIMIGFAGRKRFRYFVSYRDGALRQGAVYRAPLDVAVLTPAPPVAVLTSSLTASAGEVVAVAFRGRPDTRSFGWPTAGATNAPFSYRLADGAVLRFGVVYYVDRDRRVYETAIEPDVSFPDSADSAQVEAAAARWLLAQPACSRSN